MFELLIVGAIAAVAYAIFSSNAAAAQAGAPGEVQMVPDLWGGVITNDPDTWPQGDAFWDVCRAIATAEGANVPGSNPDRLNNPGDISDGYEVYGGEYHSGSYITHFPSRVQGWSWLYNKVKNGMTGNSTVYLRSMTWTQVAHTWAGNWQDWLNNVTDYLGVSPDDQWSTYANS